MKKVPPKNPAPDVYRYYLELGTLFEEISAWSGFMNLGWLAEGQNEDDVSVGQRQLVRKIAELGNFRAGMTVLDVGCGLGGPAALFSEESGCRVTGLDPGLFQRKRIGTRMKKPDGESVFSAVSGDALDLPFRPGSFDRITSVESAFHYPDKSRFLRESSHALKKDGLLVVADFVRKPGKRGAPLAGTLMEALAAPQVFDAGQYRAAAEQERLKLLRFEDISQGVARSMRLWRRNFLRKYSALRKRVPLKTLLKIGAALMLAPDLAPLAPFRYIILVFGFDENHQ
jgi:cyclopropane fatty-acyl-phospholipid synthase-like methyltransferase